MTLVTSGNSVEISFRATLWRCLSHSVVFTKHKHMGQTRGGSLFESVSSRAQTKGDKKVRNGQNCGSLKWDQPRPFQMPCPSSDLTLINCWDLIQLLTCVEIYESSDHFVSVGRKFDKSKLSSDIHNVRYASKVL